MFSASGLARRNRQGIVLVLLVVGSTVACFKDPSLDVTKPRHCQADNKSCPWGYVCGPDGLCCMSSNGKTCSVATSSGGIDAIAVDGLTGQEVGWGAVDTSALDGRTDVQPDVAQVVPPEAGAGGIVETGGTLGSGGVIDAPGTGGAGGAGGVDAPTVDLGVDVPISVGGSGGGPATGGTSATGGIAGTGGMGVGGSGSGGQVTCSGSTKLCNGSCIPSTSCCGGCSGNTPVCSNGMCVGRTIGDTCSIGAECASTVCADGVCCNVACDGQCESCSTATSKGTCVPTTNPRTACAGAGVCVGICDGSATNRKTCVFPDDKTSCGVSASCSGGKLTTAAVCNGAGTCNGSTTSPCTYGCKTDGTVGCATSCPSGQGLCGGSCVDILSTASHCGGACQACSGTTPYCHSGSCVQCLTGNDCVSYADGATCGSNYFCQCRAPNPGNLVENGGFDTSSGLAGWTINTGFTTFATDDAEGCPVSGSIQLSTSAQGDYGGMSQCIAVAANTTYNFGYGYKQQVSEAFICNLFFHAGANCPQWFSVVSLPSGATTGTAWQYASTSTTSPASAGSASISCTINSSATAGWIDQIYLNPTASGY